MNGVRPTRAAAATLVGLVALASAAASPARASLFDTYGYGSRGTSLGGAMVALSRAFDAVYYNPANLLSTRINHIGMGLNLIAPDVTIERLDGDGDLGALDAGSNLGFHLGLATPVGGLFENKVAIGLALFQPLLRFTRVESIDPSVPYLYRYHNLPDKLIIAAAAAFEPVSWLRVGLGAQVLAELDGRVDASLSLSERRITRENIDIELTAEVAPTVGVAIGPVRGFRLGLTYRGALELGYRVPIEILVEEIGDLSVYVEGVSLYTPDQLALGVSYETAPETEAGLSVEAGFTFERWSAAPPAGARFRLAIDDSVLRTDEHAAGREVHNLIESNQDPVPLEGRDTLTPRLGLEWRPTADFAVRGGYFYRPTPLPRPTQTANTLDATAHGLSLGGGFAFRDPTRVHRTPLIIDIGAQLTLVNDRLVPKADGAAPGGTYWFGGPIWNLQANIRHEFY